jgi:hypothetical protein
MRASSRSAGGALHLLAGSRERASFSGRRLSSTSAASSVCVDALGRELHLVEDAHRIGHARHVEHEHRAGRGSRAQRVGGERLGAIILQRVEHSAGLSWIHSKRPRR